MNEYAGDRTTGFASPAQDHVEGTIDLSDVLDLRRPSRYPARVSGDALSGRGIRHGDIIIVDTAVEPFHGAVVIASVCDEMRICELAKVGGEWHLRPSGADQSDLVVDDGADVAVWGVATGLVRTSL